MTRSPSNPAAALRRAIRFARRDLPPATAYIDGPTLLLYRDASGVKAGEVAERLDISKQRVSAMETAGCSPEHAFRFRAAVDQLAAERKP